MSASFGDKKSVKKRRRNGKQRILTLPYGKRNYLILLLGLISVILGFVFLLKGDTVICVILFVLGWAVFIPVGLFLMPKRGQRAS
jgi:hypothetical protein